MASKNPFGQLSIRRDEEEEVEVKQSTQAKVTPSNPVLFQQTQEKKKKKVRPEEKKKSEEVAEEKEEFEGGFSVFKKKAPTKQKVSHPQEDVVEEKEKRHQTKHYTGYKDRARQVDSGKRMFERQSGTGRGKEISKGGAGGKHTWGANPKNIAKHAEEEYNPDDDVFNRALNAKPKTQKEEKVEEEVVEEQAEKTEETPKQEEQTEQPAEDNKEVNFDKRKKKKGFVEEEKKDILERPENPLSVNEYLQKLQEQKQNLSSSKPKTTPVVENSDLKPRTKDEDLTIGINAEIKKQSKTKPKEKKQEAKDLNIDFKFGDAPSQPKYEERQERSYGKKKGPKFQYKADEFPEL